MTITTITIILYVERSDILDIKKLRIKLRMTQTELAKACGVSLTTIQLWEREVTTPKEENLIKLKEVLKVGE